MWLPSKSYPSKASVSTNFVFVNGTPEHLWSSLELGAVKKPQKQESKESNPRNVFKTNLKIFFPKELVAKRVRKRMKKPAAKVFSLVSWSPRKEVKSYVSSRVTNHSYLSLNEMKNIFIYMNFKSGEPAKNQHLIDRLKKKVQNISL